MTKLAILGVTGLVGRVLTKLALGQGYEVRVLCRSQGSADSLPDGVEVVIGDYFDADAIDQVVAGCDAVLSTVGPEPVRRPNKSPQDLQEAMDKLIGAMERHGISRFINLASAGTRFSDEPLTLSRKLMRWSLGFIVPYVIPSKEAELGSLVKSSLDWTSIRPPLITDSAKGQFHSHLTKAQGFKVNTTQLATFMLTAIEDKTLYRTAPFVGTRG